MKNIEVFIYAKIVNLRLIGLKNILFFSDRFLQEEKPVRTRQTQRFAADTGCTSFCRSHFLPHSLQKHALAAGLLPAQGTYFPHGVFIKIQYQINENEIIIVYTRKHARSSFIYPTPILLCFVLGKNGEQLI